MLKHLQKFFKSASAGQQKEVTEMATQEGQTVQAAGNQAEELSAQLASATEAMTTLQNQIEELTVKYDQVVTALSAAEKAKADLIADVKAKQAAARKTKVEATIGENEKAVKLLAATENMGDEAFDAVVSALAGSMEAEAKTGMFKEVGTDAVADASKVIEKSTVMKALEDKYQAK